MKIKDLHVVKILANSDFAYLFTFTRGKLWPLNAGNPVTSEEKVLSYAKKHKYGRIFIHSHVTLLTVPKSIEVSGE